MDGRQGASWYSRSHASLKALLKRKLKKLYGHGLCLSVLAVLLILEMR